MQIKRHSLTTTTPKVWAAIQVSDEPAWVLAERYVTPEQTVRKRRTRDGVEDRRDTPHRRKTTLTPAPEAIARRKTLLLSLDDLLAMGREFLKPNVLRSALDRCLRKHDPTGEHAFNELGIEHRLSPPKSSHTIDMIERFTSHIEKVFQSHHFRSGKELAVTLHRYA